MARGIEKQNIFLDDTDRENFLERLGNVLADTGTDCLAWALLPNHLHLLLRTGETPIATVMRRTLTAYAVRFNRRHDRNGHVFQNRYKSILCQEDAYLLELVRYIHLNPVRAGIVGGMEALDEYLYTGHAVIMQNTEHPWQNTGYVLSLFDPENGPARQHYRAFVSKGIAQGSRPDLIGGGFIRSIGGWEAAKQCKEQSSAVKSDERILGDSDFVEDTLQAAAENFSRKYRLRRNGLDLEELAEYVAGIFSLAAEDIFLPGKQKTRVKARSVFCYWAVRELGYSMTALARRMRISQPAVSVSVKRGEAVVLKEKYRLSVEKFIN
ncbi:MAG: transposase [Desulfosalsimonadaceae bacterium]